MVDVVRKEYDAEATNYDTNLSATLPLIRLDNELFISAIGDATGAVILDLAGGSGVKARFAINAGAAAVDIIDISPGMMREGQNIEATLNRDVMRWFEADISQPLDHLPLKPQYDIVMANWPFDHVENMDVLEGMFRNIEKYLKPGGRFLGARTCNPRVPEMIKGSLGAKYANFEDIPGGVRYRFSLDSFESDIVASSMEATYSGSTEIYEKFGLVDIQVEPYENAKVVKEHPKLWEAYLQEPGMAMVKATKKI
ncbi:S-adenosyl-L-methionine-dependent methyltransferase [Xylaria bambusicola]|uniref:S-adenosyl-L-methionine-dependent methyltransferase n=1 Tax=Xylaria bambusicola TaxID=326684 RepID=UPI0020079259|nr:S-adenosyl-L-methionine-dependent methyltransferase [Xylaria bambusicola]KAI0508350.1 S-adenosyl-L-methionine-dependent methyltransferase [Xylaria bambusicola]